MRVNANAVPPSAAHMLYRRAYVQLLRMRGATRKRSRPDLESIQSS